VIEKKKMTKYSLSVKIDDDTFKYFSVPHEVYVYVRQLETYITNPKNSKLKELYPSRFRNEENNE
jgi:hypothetical protein